MTLTTENSTFNDGGATMTDETIKALLEAGDKATQGEWECCENIKGTACHIGSNGSKTGGFVHLPWLKHENQWENKFDEYFVVQSANARPALKALYAEVQELREKVKAQEWQPIETAPKDGTRILGYTEYGVEMVKYCENEIKSDNDSISECQGGWIGVEQDSTCLPHTKYSWLKEKKEQHQPTHWMPLPAAPKQEGE